MNRPLRALLPLLLIALVGCGGGAKDNGITKLSATDALAKVRAAANDVTSVHVAGDVDQGGEQLHLDVHAGKGKGSGSISVGDGTMEIRFDGDTYYLKGDSAVFEKFGAPAAQASLVADKWLKSPANGGQFGQFGTFLDVDQLFGDLLTPDGQLSAGKTTTVNGQKVLELVDTKNGSDTGSLYVATTGDPLPVRIQKAGSGGGAIDFSDYGADFTVQVPKDAVDMSQLGQ